MVLPFLWQVKFSLNFLHLQYFHIAAPTVVAILSTVFSAQQILLRFIDFHDAGKLLHDSCSHASTQEHPVPPLARTFDTFSHLSLRLLFLWLHFFWLDVATPLLHLLSVWLLHIFGQNLESWHPLKSPGLLLKVSRWRFMCSPLLSLYELCVACVRPKVGGVAHTQCWTCRLQFAGTRVLSPLMACQ